MKKSFLFKAAVFGLVILLGASLAGCAGQLKESDVSYAGPMVENMLKAIQDNDYNGFSRDFSDPMKNAMTQDSFNALRDLLKTKIGDYQEKSFSGAANRTQNNQNYIVVIYKAKYTQESGDVLVTASFSDNNGVQKVEGINFNSPNLRK